MNYLFFDTETSGIPNFKEQSEHPSQPFIVQLAALLTDDIGNNISSMNFIILPKGNIPNDVAAIHGISTEKASQLGIDALLAFNLFIALLSKADCLVAHNISFDTKLIKIMAGQVSSPGIRELLEAKKQFCTMRIAQPLCKLEITEKQKMAGFTGFKQPKLQEAYKHFFGIEFDKAHNALADVTACKDIFFKMTGAKTNG